MSGAMTAPVRLRFAPSPTGYFHVGGARTALFNWLFARQHEGVFVLRIEDTDGERNRAEWVEGIQSAMRWLGLDWDEGPYFQSERASLYTEAAEKLLADGRVYYCDCTREAIDARTKGNATPGYDGFCRDRGLGPAPGRALRFRVADEGTLSRTDLIRGTADIELRTIEDFVVVRGNGTPVFILANVVDDMDMRISHVIRGEEHLPNVPKALLLWDALGGGPPPVFAHLPVLVNEKRQKLSKRRDKVALESYRDQGYLAEAMRNYLALLGWAPGDDREVLTVEEMLAEFRLEDVVPSPAFFDERKLAHFNGEYIRADGPSEFVDRVIAFVRSTVLDPMGALVQERAATLAEGVAMVDFFFTEQPAMDPAAFAKAVEKEPGGAILDEALVAYESCPWTDVAVKDVTTQIGERHGLKLGKAQAPIRVAVTGRTVGPPLFESLVVLGRERTLARIRAARARLG
ncbi:MAG: glutamyl-tRNA synthetase [Acidimicrobiaceae bacterium]|nr:glutamyl-tRNA synthetase [Acidimicrobiaceae bacterium]